MKTHSPVHHLLVTLRAHDTPTAARDYVREAVRNMGGALPANDPFFKLSDRDVHVRFMKRRK